MSSAALAAAFAAGMLLHLLLVVLTGARPAANRSVPLRLRRLDRLFLLLFGALLLWHSGNFLALALEPFAGEHRVALIRFARGLAFTGLAALPALLAHVHTEYSRSTLNRFVWIFYVPLLSAPLGIAAAVTAAGIPRGPWTNGFILYFIAALVVGVAVNVSLVRRAAGHLPLLHGLLAALFAALAAACAYVFLFAGEPTLAWFAPLLMISSIVPSGLVGFWMFRFNFLEARAQQSVALAALALLGVFAYALVITRLAQALDHAGYLPATITEALLVFALILLIEPVSKVARRWLSRRVATELGRLDALHRELQLRSLTVPPEVVRSFAEERISELLEFPVTLDAGGRVQPEAGRELTVREEGLLRVAGAHSAEALERSRLIADRVRLERELAEREKMAALGEMVAFIAHRLKNPLSAINTLVQVMGEQSPEAARHCEVIRGEIRRLTQAVNDLLRFTRPEPPQSAGDVRPTPASDVIKETAALFAADAVQKGVRLDLRAPPDAILPARRELLHDILTSLVSNALDAAPVGSVVRITCEPNGDATVLAVEDAGAGVPQHNREKIFEPFFTQKPGGTGLGLALARRRAQEVGAEIRCISPARDGRGARFEVRFRRN